MSKEIDTLREKLNNVLQEELESFKVKYNTANQSSFEEQPLEARLRVQYGTLLLPEFDVKVIADNNFILSISDKIKTSIESLLPELYIKYYATIDSIWATVGSDDNGLAAGWFADVTVVERANSKEETNE